MADTATKARQREYFTLTVTADGIGTRRFTYGTHAEAAAALVKFDRAFADSPHGASINHVRSFR